MLTNGVPPKVKLLDFGIAKFLAADENNAGLTSVGRRVGTPSVMAPEQILRGQIDSRTDIYALGALLYQLLTGRKPFESAIPADLAHSHLEAPPPRPSERVAVSSAFDVIVARSMDKLRENRFPTVGAFLEALRHAVYGSVTRIPLSDERYAIGLFVDIRLGALPQRDEEALDSVTARMLERTDEYMRENGLMIVMCTSNTILGMELLGGKADSLKTKRRTVLDLARTLRDSLTRDATVHVNMTLHVDRVTVCCGENGELEITSGVLARTETWAPTDNISGLCATPDFLDGLHDCVLEPGPDGLFIVTRH